MYLQMIFSDPMLHIVDQHWGGHRAQGKHSHILSDGRSVVKGSLKKLEPGVDCWWDIYSLLVNLGVHEENRKLFTISLHYEGLQIIRVKILFQKRESKKSKNKECETRKQTAIYVWDQSKRLKIAREKRDLSTNMNPTGVPGHPPSPRESSTSARGKALNLKHCWWPFHKGDDSVKSIASRIKPSQVPQPNWSWQLVNLTVQTIYKAHHLVEEERFAGAHCPGHWEDAGRQFGHSWAAKNIPGVKSGQNKNINVEYFLYKIPHSKVRCQYAMCQCESLTSKRWGPIQK